MGVNVKERPKGSGIWWVFINHKGKRKARKIGSDEKTANEVAKKIEAKLVLGDFEMEKPQSKCPTFGEYSKKWLAFINVNRRESTYERYSQVLRDHVLPALRKKPLDSISRGEIRDLLMEKAKKLDVSVIRDVISGVLGFAVDDELIKSNPITGITKKLGLNKNKSADVDPLSERELNLFLEKCEEVAADYYPFFFTAAR